jgi:hypothetical protein
MIGGTGAAGFFFPSSVFAGRAIDAILPRGAGVDAPRPQTGPPGRQVGGGSGLAVVAVGDHLVSRGLVGLVRSVAF